MDTLTRLDDPLDPPTIEPDAVRRRASTIRQRRSRRQRLGLAGGAVAIALAVWIARPDSVKVDVRDGVAAEPPAATCAPAFQVTRSLLVMSGSTPEENDSLITALEGLLGTQLFANEVHTRLDADLAARLPVSSILAAVSVDRPPAAAVLRVGIQLSSRDDAERVSAQTVPALTSLLETTQRNLPIEDRLPGPVVQELFPEPVVTEVRC